MKKLAWFILTLFLLMLYSHVVKHVLEGGQRLGPLTEPFKQFITFFSTSQQAFKQVTEDQSVMNDSVPEYSAFNRLEQSVYVLNPSYRVDLGTWRISLVDLRENKEVKFWDIDETNWIDTDIVPFRRVLRHPILMEDGGLIFIGENTHTIYRVDQSGGLIWKNEGTFHHSINIGPNGNLWTCIMKDELAKQRARFTFNYLDHGIAKLDINTGKILYEKSLTDILIENSKKGFLIGIGNGFGDRGRYPMHLNDVEVVFNSGAYFEKGDLFLSLRNRSAILHYRPGTNQLLDIIHGDFSSQHDVDIQNDSTLSIFNNNSSALAAELEFRKDVNGLKTKINLNQSNVTKLDLRDKSSSALFVSSLDSLNVFTKDQGLHEKLDDLWIIESQNQSDLVIFDKDKLVYHGYLMLDSDGRKVNLNWCRFYNDINLPK